MSQWIWRERQENPPFNMPPWWSQRIWGIRQNPARVWKQSWRTHVQCRLCYCYGTLGKVSGLGECCLLFFPPMGCFTVCFCFLFSLPSKGKLTQTSSLLYFVRQTVFSSHSPRMRVKLHRHLAPRGQLYPSLAYMEILSAMVSHLHSKTNRVTCMHSSE